MISGGKPKLDAEALRSKLKVKQLLSERALSLKHPEASEFLQIKGLLGPGKIREHASKLLASGALAGSLLLASPQLGLLSPKPSDSALVHPVLSLNQVLAIKLAEILPKKIEALTTDQEIKISHLLHEVFGIEAVPRLGSTRLNHVYGLMGAEQHLPRFPGDTISQHNEHQKAGITPGLGGWGYFSRSKNQMTPEDYLKEKYYVAVQTLYLPDWRVRTKFLSQWYKHRKVVVVNPLNGKAIVGVIADAGPSWWTGKHFGGSPETMAYLGLNIGWQKGPVIVYFVDDPENNVNLGPLENHLEKPLLLTKR